jgi:hypothetical protein
VRGVVDTIRVEGRQITCVRYETTSMSDDRVPLQVLLWWELGDGVGPNHNGAEASYRGDGLWSVGSAVVRAVGGGGRQAVWREFRVLEPVVRGKRETRWEPCFGGYWEALYASGWRRVASKAGRVVRCGVPTAKYEHVTAGAA